MMRTAAAWLPGRRGSAAAAGRRSQPSGLQALFQTKLMPLASSTATEARSPSKPDRASHRPTPFLRSAATVSGAGASRIRPRTEAAGLSSSRASGARRPCLTARRRRSVGSSISCSAMRVSMPLTVPTQKNLDFTAAYVNTPAWHTTGSEPNVRSLGEQEMKRTPWPALVALAVLMCTGSRAGAISRIKDLVSGEGIRECQLIGYGPVISAVPRCRLLSIARTATTAAGST